MDRIVWGDVGFGKTEVAMRAAFVAVQAGRQVALLAPTTLLVQQHVANFRDRFADWPVRIESLSRFRSGAETTTVLRGLEQGTVDLMVETGVGERLKRLAKEVQVLVVTHSPQVAAIADRHWLIRKTTTRTTASTDVLSLDTKGRREEIARMLSGAEVTAEARAAADKLLATAS